jgi:ABC-type phosphate transport system substrate-binding protein
MARLHSPLLVLLTACCSLWLGAGTARAEDQIAVIVSSRARHLNLDGATLRGIYLKKIFLDNAGHPFIPVNLPPDSPLRHAFARSVFRMDEQQLQTYWNRRYFQGVSPPYVLGSQKAVVRFVAETPGAIGYVNTCYLDDRVRPLLLLPAPQTHRQGAARCPGEPAR